MWPTHSPKVYQFINRLRDFLSGGLRDFHQHLQKFINFSFLSLEWHWWQISTSFATFFFFDERGPSRFEEIHHKIFWFLTFSKQLGNVCTRLVLD